LHQPWLTFISCCTGLLCCVLVVFSQSAIAQSGSSDPTILYLPAASSTYGKLANELEAALKAESVNHITVRNGDFWHPYQQGLREGRKAIYFAQPHFAAWAMTKHNFTPIYKLHGRLKYVLAAKRVDDTIFEVQDLSGKVICREAGLNLGTVWLNDVLSNNQITARSKELPSVEHVMAKQTLDCDAFVINDYAYDRINQQQRSRFIRLAQSPIYSHNAFIAHPEISPEQVSLIDKALKSKGVKRVLKPYFTSLSKWQNLLPVKEDDYGARDIELLTTYWGP